MGLIDAGRQLGRTIQNAGRLREIVGVFARHGFYNLAERIQLGRFFLERISTSDEIEKLSTAQRLRMSFEELGPTFVKLGQLLAARPDLVPQDFVDEFSKLHDRVLPLDFATVHGVLKAEFGESLDEKFLSFNKEPLGSASIAQVHYATLKTGESVVVKVQRPGIAQTISEDLSVLFFLADLANQYLPELKPLNLTGIVDEYAKTLDLETDFIVEANNIRRFRANFETEPSIKIPQVHFTLCTHKVLTMEALPGLPITQRTNADFLAADPHFDSYEVARRGLRAYMKMVFIDGLFHGDLHAGNFFILPGNQIGLVDFGVVGRLSPNTRASIAAMLIALSKEDYESLAIEFVDLSQDPLDINVDKFANQLRSLLSPYFGLTLKEVNVGKLLLSAAGVAARGGVQVPSELMLFFKSIVSIEGLGHRLRPDFDVLSFAIEYSGELVKESFDPKHLLNTTTRAGRDTKNLLQQLPRQLLMLTRRLNSSQNFTRIRLDNALEIRQTVERSARLLFLGVLISALLLSGALVLALSDQDFFLGLPGYSVFAFVMTGFLSLFAVVNYFRGH
jgi:ubiquinone biosynthesis protein